MRSSTKAMFKELIDFYEANGRNRKKTVEYFKTKNFSEDKTRQWIRMYEREGISILDKKITRTPPVLFPHITKKVLDLLKEDPSVSCCEGAAKLNISTCTFRKHRKMLLNPGMLSTEKKIQLGLIPPPRSRPPPEETTTQSESLEDEEMKIKEEGLIHPRPPLEEMEDSIESEFLEEVEVKVKIEEDDLDLKVKTEDEEGGGDSNQVVVLKSKRRQRQYQTLSRRCLLCYINLGRYFEKRSTENRCCTNSPTLTCSLENNCDCEFRENLNVIFALKNIFGLSSAQLSHFMEVSNGRNPWDWYDMCGHCDALLKEAMAVEIQILRLSRELDKHKKKIMKTFEESSFRSSTVEESGLRYNNHIMTKLIRESISPSPPEKNEQVSSNPSTDHLKSQKPTDHLHDCDTTDTDNAPPHTQVEVQNSISIRDDANSNSTPDTDVPCDPLGIGRVDVVDARTTTFQNLVKPSQTVCETCGKELRKNDIPLHALLEHGILLEGYKKFECPKEGCQYKTVYAERFRSHERNAHRPKCLACQFCEKKFSTKSYLAQHEEAHRNRETKPFQCEQCGLGFAIQDYLRMHKREVHEGYVYPKRRQRMAERKIGPTKNSTVISNAETVTTTPVLLAGVDSSGE